MKVEYLTKASNPALDTPNLSLVRRITRDLLLFEYEGDVGEKEWVVNLVRGRRGKSQL